MKKKILITGANGFVGKNVISAFLYREDVVVSTYNRNDSLESLKASVETSDVILHLAGCNRSSDETDFQKINVDLTSHICGLLEDAQSKKTLIFSSSSQSMNDSIYGKTKGRAEEAIQGIKNILVSSLILRLPNLFGKWSKPNYNSVVATFCYNIARNIEVKVNPSSQKIDFCYIDQIVSLINELVTLPPSSPGSSIRKVEGSFQISVSELHDLIKKIHESRYSFTVLDFNDPLIIALTATYNHFLPPEGRNVPVNLKQDQRGWLFELIKNKNAGQIFISTTKPGFFRGNHFHHTKIEKFCVIKGSAEIKMRDIFDKDVKTYNVDDKNIQIIDIPTGYTHNIINTGDSDLITIFWASEVFSTERPDTYFQEV
jgi:UDP-2-acetamido-2,6-beta-L-arabino-hexul-4-ose reductase